MTPFRRLPIVGGRAGRDGDRQALAALGGRPSVPARHGPARSALRAAARRGRAAFPSGGLRGPHEAPDHRAPAGHDGADDGRRRPRAAVGCGSWSPPSLGGTAGRRRRQRHQHGRRPRHRPADGAHEGPAARHRRDRRPRAALVFAIALEVVAFAWLWATVNLLSAVLAVSATALLRLRLHAVAEAPVSEHNIVIGGAAGAVPVLVGWSAVTGEPRLGAGRALRRHLLLDPAALLGPRHPLPRRLRRRRRADAAVGARGPGRRRPHPRLHRRCSGR